MRVLFISRKKSSDIGGLSRFALNLTSRFPHPYYLLSPDSLITLVKLPFLKFDLIHLCDATLLPLGVILKLLFRKPLTLTAHGLDITYRNIIYQRMLRLLLPKADAVIVDSQAARGLLDSFRLQKEKISIIPPGIAINHLKSPNPHNLPNLKGKIVLLTVGNLVLRKGHVWFLKNVFSKLSDDFTYVIVGNGPLAHLGGGLGRTPRVILTGRLTDHQLAYIYSLADIYVCPNQHIKGDFEGFGISVGEAAAMGLPVVASNVDGIPQIIKDDKNGILVEPVPQAFIEAINRLKSPTLRKSLGTKAKLYTKTHYNFQKTAKKYKEVFDSAIHHYYE